MHVIECAGEFRRYRWKKNYHATGRAVTGGKVQGFIPRRHDQRD
tara:strand:- start:9512 stop:9643 length:132 start_codon:yes stop_codon:yes gene_type:complete